MPGISWPPRNRRPWWASLVWLLLWVISLIVFIVVARHAMLPFCLVWIGFAVIWGFWLSGIKPTLWVASTMIATAVAAVGLDAPHRDGPAEELSALGLISAVFLIVVWKVRRRQSAHAEQARLSEEKGHLLATQRRFLQDTSHQLRTPITIALGHAELLARELAGRGAQRDIHVVVGELTRLKTLSEHLLMIAVSEDPEFLRTEPVALDGFISDVLGRWKPAAQRRWELGHIEAVTVHADRERLALAVDALLENAVRHTAAGDVIRLSVLRDEDGADAGVVVEDTGEGIAAAELETIFERFQTGSGDSGSRSTGLGLALVRAIARGHGGEVRVHSEPGTGSRFELMLSLTSAIAGDSAAMPSAQHTGGTAEAAGTSDPGTRANPQ